MAVIDIHKSASIAGRGAGNKRFPEVRLRLKDCERCGGDVTTGRDWHGDFLRCLQCGWYKDEPGDAVSGLVETSMRSLMEEMEQSLRSQRRAS